MGYPMMPRPIKATFAICGVSTCSKRVPVPAFRRSQASLVKRPNEPRKAKGASSIITLVPLFDQKSLDGGCCGWCRDFWAAVLVWRRA